MITIAQRVKKYRRQPPYPTLRKMAAELGVSTSFLSEVERGVKIPRGETLVKLARFFGTTVEKIYESQTDIQIVQISAVAVGDQLKVVCLMSDGSVQIKAGNGG